MLMTPLTWRFTAVLARKGMAADWQLGAMPGSTAAALVFQRGQEENHVLVFDVSKASDTTPHGALAPLLRHMGVLEELIKLFHTLRCGSTLPLSQRTPPPRAFASIVACGKAARKAPCSTSSS